MQRLIAKIARHPITYIFLFAVLMAGIRKALMWGYISFGFWGIPVIGLIIILVCIQLTYIFDNY